MSAPARAMGGPSVGPPPYPPPTPHPYPPPPPGPARASRGTGTADDGAASDSRSARDSGGAPRGEDGTPGLSWTSRVSAQQVVLGTAVVTVLGVAIAAARLDPRAGLAVAALFLLSSGASSFLAVRARSSATGEALAVTSVLSTAVLVGVLSGTATHPAQLVAALAATAAALWTALQVVPGRLRTWPVAALVAGQVAVLAWLSTDPRPLGVATTGLALAVALLAVAAVGLAVAWFGDGAGAGLLSRTGGLTSMTWWVTGVVVAEQSAWGAGGLPAAALLVAAALGLLVTAADRVPGLRTGDRDVVPVVAGITAGGGVAGTAHGLGPDAVSLSGVVGLLLAALVAVAAARGRDWVPRDAGLAAAVLLTGLAVLQDAAAGRWSWVALLLVLTALASGLLSARRSESRPATIPLTVGAVATALLLALTEGPVAAAGIGSVLVAVAVAALAQAAVLARHRPPVPPVDVPQPLDDHGHPDLAVAFARADGGSRPDPAPEPDPDSPDGRASAPTATTGTVTGLVGVLVAAGGGTSWVTPVLLAALGATLLGYATATGRPGSGQLGAVLLVLAAWTGAGQLGWTGLEQWTVPVAVALLLVRAREVGSGPSWPAWGPALSVGLLPSVLLAVLDPSEPRQPALLGLALVVVLAGLRWEVRAPFLLGAVSVAGVALGWAVDTVPGPGLVGLLVAGVLLFAVAWRRDQRTRAGLLDRLQSFR